MNGPIAQKTKNVISHVLYVGAWIVGVASFLSFFGGTLYWQWVESQNDDGLGANLAVTGVLLFFAACIMYAFSYILSEDW